MMKKGSTVKIIKKNSQWKDKVGEVIYVAEDDFDAPLYKVKFTFTNGSGEDKPIIQFFYEEDIKEIKKESKRPLKEAAEAQRKALFANGCRKNEGLNEMRYDKLKKVRGMNIFNRPNYYRSNINEAYRGTFNDIIRNLSDALSFVLNAKSIDEIEKHKYKYYYTFPSSSAYESLDEYRKEIVYAIIEEMERTRNSHKDDVSRTNKGKELFKLLMRELPKAGYKIINSNEGTIIVENDGDVVAFVDKVVELVGGAYSGTGRGYSWTVWNIATPDSHEIRAGYDRNSDNFRIDIPTKLNIFKSESDINEAYASNIDDEENHLIHNDINGKDLLSLNTREDFKRKHRKIKESIETAISVSDEVKPLDMFDRYVYIEDSNGKKIPSWIIIDKIATAENVCVSDLMQLLYSVKTKYKIYRVDAQNFTRMIVAAPQISAKDIQEDFADYLLGKSIVTEINTNIHN